MDNEANNSSKPSPAKILQDEIENVILRYSHEADLVVYEVLGVLELCKVNLLARAKRQQDEEHK